MAKKSRINPNLDKVVISFAQLSAALFSFIIGTSLVIFFADLIFPQAIALGHHTLSSLAGLLYASMVISLIAVGVMPVVEYLANQKGVKLNNNHWLLIYWFVNAGAVWFVGRMAEVVGFGIRSWLVAVFLGLAFDLVQGYLMKNVVSRIRVD